PRLDELGAIGEADQDAVLDVDAEAAEGARRAARTRVDFFVSELAVLEEHGRLAAASCFEVVLEEIAREVERLREDGRREGRAHGFAPRASAASRAQRSSRSSGPRR